MRLIALFLICLPLLANAHGDAHDRLKSLDAQIRNQPGNAELHLRRGRIFLEEDHLDEARADLEKVLALDPSRLGARYFLAETLFYSGQHALAEQQAQLFINAHEPQNLGAQSRGYWLIGQTRMARHQAESAIAAYRLAFKATADASPDQYKLFVEACLAAGGPYLDEALRMLDAKLAMAGSVDLLQDMALDVELQAGHMDATLARLDSLIALKKRLPFLYARKASVLVDAGRYQEASIALESGRSALASINERRRQAPVYVDLAQRMKDLGDRLAKQTPAPRKAPLNATEQASQ